MTKPHIQIGALFALLVSITAGGTLYAWHAEGHEQMSRAAMRALGDDVPAFLREGDEAVAHYSVDADLYRHKATPDLANTEHGEHYLDYELLSGDDPPRLRHDYYRWCFERDIDPRRAGTLPWAIHEWTQRLTLALAEHRKWPDDPHIKQKCLLFAGFVAHYAEDLHVPLHTTIHYDGRADENQRSPRSGIHMRVDAAAAKVPWTQADARSLGEIEPFEDLWAGVWEHFRRSHGRVDQVYALEDKWPAWNDKELTDAAVIELIRTCQRDAVQLTARLIATAWHDSANVELPGWHRR